MKIAFYDTHSYDKTSFGKVNEAFGYHIDFFEFKLNENTAPTSRGYDVVCVFVNDVVNAEVIAQLKESGVKLIALRALTMLTFRQQRQQELRLPAFLHIRHMPLPSTELRS